MTTERYSVGDDDRERESGAYTTRGMPDQLMAPLHIGQGVVEQYLWMQYACVNMHVDVCVGMCRGMCIGMCIAMHSEFQTISGISV